MKMLVHPEKRLVVLLNIIALHSLIVGIGLIFHPSSLMEFAGYKTITEHFFPVQGGVFHVLMAVGYYLGGRDLIKHRCLVVFAVIIKAFATVFLFSYFIFVEPIWMVFISGIGDGLMALFIYLAFKKYEESVLKQ
jgi:hypothetical protein